MSTKLAARAIIICDDQILLVKHHGSPFWSLPGGKLDEGEGMKDALVRELDEELGVNADLGDMRFINEFMYSGENYCLEFFFEIKNGQDFRKQLSGTHMDLELEEVEWFKLNDLPDLMPQFLLEKLPSLDEDGIEYFSTV